MLVFTLSLCVFGQVTAETNSTVGSPVPETQHLNDTEVVNVVSLDHPGPLYPLPVQSKFTIDTNPPSLPVLGGNATTGTVHVDPHICGVKNPDGTVRPLRIMTSSTAEYFPVFMNWLVYYHKICPNVANIYFICLDAAVEKILPSHGFTCAYVFHSSIAAALHDIWLVRTKITHDLLHKQQRLDQDRPAAPAPKARERAPKDVRDLGRRGDRLGRLGDALHRDRGIVVRVDVGEPPLVAHRQHQERHRFRIGLSWNR